MSCRAHGLPNIDAQWCSVRQASIISHPCSTAPVNCIGHVEIMHTEQKNSSGDKKHGTA